MKKLLMLAFSVLSVAHAAEWDVMDLLNNLKRQSKIVDAQVAPLRQVNQKQQATYQITMTKGQETNRFQIIGTTGVNSKAFQRFEFQVKNFLKPGVTQGFSSQAGYVQGLTLALSQVCFSLTDQDHATLQKFFMDQLNRAVNIQSVVNVSKGFTRMQAAISIGPENIRFSIENRSRSTQDQCTLE